ncbi:UDP-N-acetylmuramoyl-L-alanyl-D-glutamate--2,6-diaminopimelate ligase [bacterium]|jgi:UDP-N-acetylmuramoyl-L-alanyl-D-glutamate--2,6-diaminopimelate ligase|nr:UDP-N-acetylmuramoyl-L-alanyl-D-glutamate--2,6-diaminopimelate ligase [bacterium]
MATVHYDSRLIQPGDTFICLPKGDGFIEDARRRGATDVRSMTRVEMAAFADDYYDHPSKDLTLIGVTGTNGKTTVTYFVSEVLKAAGFKPAVIGTLNSALTTPESLDVQSKMAAHLKEGGTHFVMEVSSHGIDQGRVLNMDFDVKCLTNITQDHLDYHKTFEAYSKTKQSFMKEYPGQSIYPDKYPTLPRTFQSPLLGAFNRDNIRACLAICRACDVPDEVTIKVLSTIKAPPGRFEQVDVGQPYLVIVDYAHTPDSLDNVLITARQIAEDRDGRLIVVFGCGGDRDRGKRPQMGRIAQDHSDVVVVTQDNPRSENPTQIMTDILEGMDTTQPLAIVQDRAAAIERAIDQAEPKDVVVIAGKGHETYQILATGTIDFDDRAVARQVIKECSN